MVQPWGSGCGYNLAGVPMQLTFLGIFDTVASVGMAAMSRVSEGKMAWAHGEMMSIHPEVKQCVHFAALHEQRINFPADLAASGKEALYPGMHSDVGGGYSPGGQGKDCVDAQALGAAKLSQIPLIDMHHEAIKAGVPLMTMEEIRQRPALAKYFACHPQLIDAYNGWLAGHAIAGEIICSRSGSTVASMCGGKACACGRVQTACCNSRFTCAPMLRTKWTWPKRSMPSANWSPI